MKISILCPLYNASKYVEGLNANLLRQKKNGLDEVEIIYILTESKDETEEILKLNRLNYKLIQSKDFSHSLTREKFAMKLNSDIVVFISQDIEMKDDMWLLNLVTPIIKGEAEACYSMQICKYNNIEKYTRESNYKDISKVVSKKDIKDMGLLTFFFSDASSAIKMDIYKELNGYDKKDLIINEDMYFAHKLIESGYRKKYCADSQVYHSHNFTLMQLYQRYFDTGVFFEQNPVFKSYGSTESGFSMASYICKAAFKDKNIKVLVELIPNFTARLLGKMLGQKYNKLPRKFVTWSSSAKGYWKRNGI